MSNRLQTPSEGFDAFSDDIDMFCRQQFGYKRRCASGMPPTVSVNRKAADLYLRFRPGGFWPRDSVVIARIGFAQQRRGHGTALLAKLVELADQYNVTSIGIEQTNPQPSIQNFVRKYGFASYRNDRNWLVSIDILTSKLLALAEQ
ncbi:GNAT family N-acetyltransferase [Massilia timonae]|uniref:GNAT family N-acetyltransferase n=1 Tax=Massilia timonae TaxID=47229 RepID=UPI00115FB2B1|nr:GNAT family N-acetyltransferase [Massilia timonae]